MSLIHSSQKDCLGSSSSSSSSSHFSIPGVREGTAKCISQSLVYGIEARKTLYQINGFIPKLPAKVAAQRWTSGIATSCATAGLVFFTYFSVYNRLIIHPRLFPFAGAVASFVTSFMKLPIGNSMRVMQSGRATNLISAGASLYKAQKMRGLYSGYAVCLVEDCIEMEARTRIYNALKNVYPSKDKQCKVKGALNGAVAGAVAASITTPFDTIRAHMCMNTKSMSAASVALKIGIPCLYRGVALRAASNAIKSAGFFAVYEMLE